MVKKLQEGVIPLALDSLFLHSLPPPMASWVDRVLPPEARGKYAPIGFFLVSADGSFYGGVEKIQRSLGLTVPAHQHPLTLPDLLTNSVRRFYAAQQPPKSLTEQELRVKTNQGPEPGTSVVRVFSRLTGDRGWHPSVGVSHFWIYPEEIQQLLSLSPDAGGKVRLPPGMLARLICGHLVDHQAGDALVWKGEEIRRCDLTATLEQDSMVERRFRLTGLLQMSATANPGQDSHDPYVIAGRLTTEFSVNRHSLRVERFRGYFEGTEAGRCPRGDTYDFHASTRGGSPFRIAMVEATDGVAMGSAPVLRTTLQEYHSPKMTAEWQARYGIVP